MNSLNRGPFIAGVCIGRRIVGGRMGVAPEVSNNIWAGV
jgi:hypothetical protein